MSFYAMCTYSLNSSNAFVSLYKDHNENKVVKPVLCHPCQYRRNYTYLLMPVPILYKI